MDKENQDETIKEILETENGGKNKNFFVRFLIVIILLAVLFFGFVFVQQYMLDLEAEAIVSAAQTATSMANESQTKDIKDTGESGDPAFVMEETPIPAETPTPDPAIVHTATIAVQLTSVAEFQKTVTREP